MQPKRHIDKERIAFMGKIVRIFIAIVVVLSFVVWARSDPARAADPAGSSEGSLQPGTPLSLSADDDDCKDNNNKNKDKCKCKEKGENDDDDNDCGTVKPPKDKDRICDEESKSVGGVVVVNVKKKRDKECVEASTRPYHPAVDQLPPGSGTVVSDALTLTVPSSKTRVKICFAAPPLKNKMQIFFSSTGAWLTVKTDVNQGQACAGVPGSGKYVLVAR